MLPLYSESTQESFYAMVLDNVLTTRRELSISLRTKCEQDGACCGDGLW